MIEIASSAALSTVQDLGRFGALRWGVGSAGAMDALALAAGNLLLGNDANTAAVEVPVFPFLVRFERDCRFVLTGADGAATLDEAALLPWWVARAHAGQQLRVGAPQGGAQRACRLYLCVAGGVDVPVALGSRSTQLRGAFGGFEGRALKRGDRLPIGVGQQDGPIGFGLVPPAIEMPLLRDGLPAVRVLPAAEYPLYTEASREVFWREPWKITSQSDRYGFRLAGEALKPCEPIEMRSHGIVPGVIQVPPSGQPIVQMCDAQPSGGYPKIGTVIAADLWRLGQAPIGSRVRFIETTWDEAIAAQARNDAWLQEVRRLVALHVPALAQESGR